MGNLIQFPRRRICAMGFSDAAIHDLRVALPLVLIAREGESLLGCELVVIDEHDLDARELMEWFTTHMPRFPVLLWNREHRHPDLVESCRDLLFPDRPVVM